MRYQIGDLVRSRETRKVGIVTGNLFSYELCYVPYARQHLHHSHKQPRTIGDKMSNQIKLTIDLSDELVDKVLTVIALSVALKNPMQAMMMGMGARPLPPTEKPTEKRPSMGFSMERSK